jgi:hypothetical protein
MMRQCGRGCDTAHENMTLKHQYIQDKHDDVKYVETRVSQQRLSSKI